MSKIAASNQTRNAVRNSTDALARERSPGRSANFADVATGVGEATERLLEGGTERAIFLSPEGNEAAAAAVMVARELADAGLTVLLLDLTCAGAASVPMLDSAACPGITDLLCGEAKLNDVVYRDLYSDCYLIPSGTADASRAMSAADRLPLILDTLKAKFEVVVIECGPAPVSALGILENGRSRTLLSVIGSDNALVAQTEIALRRRGCDDLIKVTPARYAPMESASGGADPLQPPERISTAVLSPLDLAHKRALAQLAAS